MCPMSVGRELLGRGASMKRNLQSGCLFPMSSNPMQPSAGLAPIYLSEDDVRQSVAAALSAASLRDKRVLLVVPDSTRSTPIGLMFRIIHDLIGAETAALDVMIALGTHLPMSEDAIHRRLEITPQERAGKYARVRLLNADYLRAPYPLSLRRAWRGD